MLYKPLALAALSHPAAYLAVSAAPPPTPSLSNAAPRPPCAPAWTRNGNYVAGSFVSSTRTVQATDASGSERTVTKNFKCISGSDTIASLSHCSTYDPSNLIQAATTWSDEGICDVSAPPIPPAPTLNPPPASTLWIREGCPKTWVEGSYYKAGELVEVDGFAYKCSSVSFVNAWCGKVDYMPGSGLYWSKAWTRQGSCIGELSPTASPVFEVLPDHQGCPEPFDPSIITTYEANDKVSVATEGAFSSSVYQCSSDPHISQWCKQFEPGSDFNLGWTLIAHCDGTMSPTSAPAFDLLEEIGNGCPKPYSSDAYYVPGDHVSVSIGHEGSLTNQVVVWECKPYPDSSYCNSGSNFAPGSKNSQLGWNRKGYCRGTLSPTSSPIEYPEPKCRWYNGTKPVIIKEWSEADLSTYTAGTRVRRNDEIFKCRGWPHNLFCKLLAYKPGQDIATFYNPTKQVYSYWGEAWDRAGMCADAFQPTVSPSSSPTRSPTSSPSVTPIRRISVDASLEWSIANCDELRSNATALLTLARVIEESIHNGIDTQLTSGEDVESVTVYELCGEPVPDHIGYSPARRMQESAPSDIGFLIVVSKLCSACQKEMFTDTNEALESIVDNNSLIQDIRSSSNIGNATFSGRVVSNFITITDSPTSIPTSSPSKIPSASPSKQPSTSPTNSMSPTDMPSLNPSATPSISPSDAPSDAPSAMPSISPSDAPSDAPSYSPSLSPSVFPSNVPSSSPSLHPSFSTMPQSSPSSSPSGSTSPSTSPTETPSFSPSSEPSSSPSLQPSSLPSDVPSSSPSLHPSFSTMPQSSPSASPSESALPSTSPSEMPSFSPSSSPSLHPSAGPSTSSLPSVSPSNVPSSAPSVFPTSSPSESPSVVPSSTPSVFPTSSPSESPSVSALPSATPTDSPSDTPSVSSAPSSSPTASPSMTPSVSSAPSQSSAPSPIPRCPSMIYSSEGWSQCGSFVGEEAGDRSGSSVSLSGDGLALAVGAPFNDGNGVDSGHVRVYNWNGTSWDQLGYDIDGSDPSDQFGFSVALSYNGRTVAIGAPYNHNNGTNSGHVRVYDWNDSSSSWDQRGDDINGEAAGDKSGYSVDISADGETVAIGAPYNDGNGGSYGRSGHVRVYDWNDSSSSWDQRGDDINGETNGDQSGSSVSLSYDGKTVAIGAPFNGYYRGHVRVYYWDGIGIRWRQRGSDIDGEANDDGSGSSVSLSDDGKTVAIGAERNSGINGTRSGHVRVFRYQSSLSHWTQLGTDIDGEAIGDYAASVSLSGDGYTLAVGAKGNDGNGVDSGHVRVYHYETYGTDKWVQRGSDIDGEAAGDKSGISVSLSSNGLIVAIGATGTGSGHVRVFS